MQIEITTEDGAAILVKSDEEERLTLKEFKKLVEHAVASAAALRAGKRAYGFNSDKEE